MASSFGPGVSRRQLIGTGALLGAGLASAPAAALVSFPIAPPITERVRPALMGRAMAALRAHGTAIPNRDVIGIADFSRASAEPRFHLVDLASGRTSTLLVSHGKGSDPAHCGRLQRFSNVDGSEASCQGAFRTSDLYVGKHGRSRRLVGLDPTNCNAEARAIVMHGAWYVSPEIVRQHGKLGRSQGCFAFDQSMLEQVLARLGPGRMIYADKV